eukprot:6287399-Amphidinium_carterae.1
MRTAPSQTRSERAGTKTQGLQESRPFWIIRTCLKSVQIQTNLRFALDASCCVRQDLCKLFVDGVLPQWL